MRDNRIHPFPSRNVSVAPAPVHQDRFRGHEHALQLTSPKKRVRDKGSSSCGRWDVLVLPTANFSVGSLITAPAKQLQPNYIRLSFFSLQPLPTPPRTNGISCSIRLKNPANSRAA